MKESPFNSVLLCIIMLLKSKPASLSFLPYLCLMHGRVMMLVITTSFSVFAIADAMFCHPENGLFQAQSLIAQRNLYIRAGGELPAVIRKEFMIGGRERVIHKSLDEVLVSNLKWYGVVRCLLFAHVLTLFSRLQAFPERGIVKKTLCNVWRALRCKIQPIETISKTCEQSMSSSPLWSAISAC